MSYPAPVSVGSATTLGFLLVAEIGLVIESFSRKTESKSIEIYDGALGYTTGEIFHDFMASYSVKGKSSTTTNTSAVTLAAPGVAVVLANLATGNGVTSGGIYTKSTSIDHSAEAFQEFSLDAIQRPGIA